MSDLAKSFNPASDTARFQGKGEMHARIRAFNWSETELGDRAGWSSSLKTAVGIMLDCAVPAYIAYGPRFVQLYNDAYIPILNAAQHPAALGKAAQETWNEVWDTVGPLLNAVLTSGQAMSRENQLLPRLRNGHCEECYFTLSFSPLTDERGQVTAVFVIVRETTSEYVANRWANTVHLLLQRLAAAADMRSIYAAFEQTVLQSPQSLLFGLWYELRQDRSGFDLIAAAGIERGSRLSPEFLDAAKDDFYESLVHNNRPEITSRSFTGDLLRGVDPHTLFVEPLCYHRDRQPGAYLVLAANSLRPNDEGPKAFLHTIGPHLENAVRRVSKSELELRVHEHRFQTVMAALPCLVWMSDTSKNCIFVNQRWLDFTGRSRQQELGSGWINGVHRGDLAEIERFLHVVDSSATLVLEYRLKHADGGYRWVLDEITPRHGVRGEFLGYIGICIDISERMKAEQRIRLSQAELRALYERLQTVRVDERLALAREVHDQLGQVLSAAKIDIKLLEEEIQPGHARLSRKKIVGELQSASRAIERGIEVVRRLATDLRPPDLENHGLCRAIRWHAADFERRTKIGCHVRLPEPSPELEDAIASALFGIFQEAMTNILRHANASRIWISLYCRDHMVDFQVRDNGVGIAPARARNRHSNGLKGMHERAAIVGGKLAIRQLPGRGTLVSVRVLQDVQQAPSKPSTGEIV